MIHFSSPGYRALLDECDNRAHYLFLGAFNFTKDAIQDTENEITSYI